MGWKTSIILASQREAPGVATASVHDPHFAARVVSVLPDKFTFLGESTFEEGAYPHNGNLYIGAYSESLIIGHMDYSGSCFSGSVPPIIEALDSILPNAMMLALELHSVVNLYGYALFENRKLVRARAGSADDGVFLDVGQPLEEERALFARSVINAAGERVWPEEFDGVVEEMDHSCMGEEFVFEISRRFFGVRFDEFDHDQLPMAEYRAKPRSFLQRLSEK